MQKPAVEHAVSSRQIVTKDFSSVATIVTTDIVALCTYKCGDYQQCLPLPTQNVRRLLYVELMTIRFNTSAVYSVVG